MNHLHKPIKNWNQTVQIRRVSSKDAPIFIQLRVSNVSELMQNAQIINDVSFMTLDETINFKRALEREKDLKDIELIDNFKKLNQKI